MSALGTVRRRGAELVPDSPAGRRWVLVNLVNSAGDGLFISGSIVFATKVIGLTGNQVGIGISLAGFAGIAGAGILGRFADRFGPRRVLGILTVSQAILYVVYGVASSFWPFLAILCLIAICRNGSLSASAALVAEIDSGQGRVRLRAQARSLYNVGFSLGAALSAAALAIGTTPAYYALPLGNAVSFIGAYMVIRRLPEAAPRPQSDRRALDALRNKPFLLTTCLTGVLAIHLSLITIVVPLWIVERTTVPQAMIGVLLVLNTLFAVTFQLGASKGAESLTGSTRKARSAAVAMALGCVVLAPSGHVPTLAAVALVTVAFLLLSYGEVLQSAGSWGMSYALAPKAAQAEYLGAFSMSSAGQAALAPVTGTLVVLRNGPTGWLILGAFIMFAAWAVGPAARRAHMSITRRFPDEAVGAPLAPAN
jgi:MFS family permease